MGIEDDIRDIWTIISDMDKELARIGTQVDKLVEQKQKKVELDPDRAEALSEKS